MDSDTKCTIGEYLSQNGQIILLIINKDRNVIEAGKLSSHLLGFDPVGKDLSDIFVDFHSKLDPFELAEEPNISHHLNINTFTGLPGTFHFVFKEIGANVLIIGSVDPEEQETMRKQIISMNNDMANLTRELQKKNYKLTELNKLKNQFIGMAAHDLRSPLGVVILYSDLLTEGLDVETSKKELKYLKQIKSTCMSMKNLIEGFLDISMIESGSINLNIGDHEPRRIAEGSILMANVHAVKRNIDIVSSYDEEILNVMCDDQKIGQVATNLLTNAVGHSKDGSRVRVRVIQNEETTRFEVSDEGDGISEDDIAKIFSPYGRGSSKKSGGERSIGLGLMIAKKIIDAHHGRIGVRSKLGEGSTFFFEIPNKIEGDDENE